MKVEEVRFEGLMPVEGYGPGFFRLGGVARPGPLLILPGSLSPWAGLADPAPLVAAGARIDLVLVGTGPVLAPLPPPFRAALEAAGLRVEAMASPAACRTFNVLLAEGRRVAAALLPV